MKIRKRLRPPRCLRYQHRIIRIRRLITNLPLHFTRRIDDYVPLDLKRPSKISHAAHVAASIRTVHGDGFGCGSSCGVVDTTGDTRAENVGDGYVETGADAPGYAVGVAFVKGDGTA